MALFHFIYRFFVSYRLHLQIIAINENIDFSDIETKLESNNWMMNTVHWTATRTLEWTLFRLRDQLLILLISIPP